jgi:hypothetical protein
VTSARTAPRRLGPWLVLAVLVILSTAARAWASRSFTVPWIAPDEMLYAMIGESLWESGTLTVRGLETPYYSLFYPALVGLPLSVGTLPDGIRVAQAVQAFVMSLAAVPVFLWGRRFLTDFGALAAAALTLAVPALAYSGLLMSEALYYPLVTLALLVLARALEDPTLWRQGVFIAAVVVAGGVRLQALILLPVFVVAAVGHAVMTRSKATLMRLLPLLAGFVTLAVLSLIALATLESFSWADMLGAYATLGEESTLSASSLEEVIWHVAGVALISVGIPLLATTLLVVLALRRGERDAHVASFLATAGAYIPLLVVQVAAFAAGHVEHVSERYLATIAPPLFLGLVLWVERRAPRPRVVVVAIGVLFLSALALTPADRIARSQGIQDALSSTALIKLGEAASPGWVRVALVLAGIAAVAIFALTPRRLVPAVVAVVAAALVVQAVAATREVERVSAAEQQKMIGTNSPSWIDDTDATRVTLLATQDRPWTADARTFFWNRSVADVVTLDGATRPVPPTVVTGTLRDSDGLVTDGTGTPLERDVVVAPVTVVLDGTKVAEAPAGLAESVGLALWRVNGPIRVRQRSSGLLPNGDITQGAVVIVPACRPGALLVTLLGKSGAPIDVRVNGVPVRTISPAPGAVVDAVIKTPPGVDGDGPCVFALDTGNLVGTTRVEFVPDG